MKPLNLGARHALEFLAQLDQAGDLKEQPNYVAYAPLYRDLLDFAKRPNKVTAAHVLGELNRIYQLRRVTGRTARIENRQPTDKACRQVLCTALSRFVALPQIYAIYYDVLDLAASGQI